MNHLAHLYLAGDTAESLIGNLAGDFVKGVLGNRFPPAIRDGIAAHRRIDAFTDSHPDVAAFRRVLIPELGHYSRVVSDVFFDHFLATEWQSYSIETLEDFVARVCATIDPRTEELPGRLRQVYPRMRDEGWLLSYRDVRGIETALYHLSFRLSRRPRLDEAVHYLADSRGELLLRFQRFFPDVIAFANALPSRT
jgi:acyl carrier protein phosphodiesterase